VNNKICVTIGAIFVSCFSQIFALTPQQVKNDTKYLWAEGIGETWDEADLQAKAALARQVSGLVNAETKESDKQRMRGNIIEYNEHITDGEIKIYAKTRLSQCGLFEISTEPNYKLIAYIERKVVDDIIAERREKISSFAQTAYRAEQRLQISDALRYYYYSFLMARQESGPVYADLGGERINCYDLDPKINSVFGNLRCEVTESRHEGNRWILMLRFTYAGQPVANLDFKYYNGRRMDGPVSVHDGTAEIELVELPIEEKIRLQIQYRSELDETTEHGYYMSTLESLDFNAASLELPVKVNEKKGEVASIGKKGIVSPEIPADAQAIEPAKISMPTSIQMQGVENDIAMQLTQSLSAIEEAIKTNRPADVKQLFVSDEVYDVFHRFFELKGSGRMSVVGKKQTYNIVNEGNQISVAPMNVKFRFNNGKTFMEELTFRFNPHTQLISGIALALTEKANADIFNAAARWPDVSRFTIQHFMEDYQTAFFLRRDDYLDQIFSDNALIIVGAVVKKAGDDVKSPRFNDNGGMAYNFSNSSHTNYRKYTKDQYLKNLRKHFEIKDYIHLTFEDNETQLVTAPLIDRGRVFAIQIAQSYESSNYSDTGYLTLLLDVGRELPIIHVRLWQPDKVDMGIGEFISNLEF